MNFTLIIAGDRLCYAETERLAVYRAVVVGFGLLALIGAAFFLILLVDDSSDDRSANVGSQLALLAALLAFCAFAAVCVWLGLFKATHAYEFDAGTCLITHSMYAPARGRRRTVHGFDEVLDITVGAHEGEQGERTFWIELTLQGQGTWELGLYQDYDAAIAALAEVRSFMANRR